MTKKENTQTKENFMKCVWVAKLLEPNTPVSYESLAYSLNRGVGWKPGHTLELVHELESEGKLIITRRHDGCGGHYLNLEVAESFLGYENGKEIT